MEVGATVVSKVREEDGSDRWGGSSGCIYIVRLVRFWLHWKVRPVGFPDG